MEGKTVIVSVLLMSLFLAQIQVDAMSCCPSVPARNTYNVCRLAGGSKQVCANISDCKIVSGSTCPNGYPKVTLENTGDAVNEYCKVGCLSSVCGALTTLENFNANEIVNGAVGKCANACSTICTKGSINVIETA
ncbi:PREDICTED: probable thionin-2.4 [Camelina sativa]|uniref:Probable thionin-2.4 n=1 Tax=Camelina sativa TaxID=90675 RepID=A0ABM0T7P8_CAMSA|nr:PREDICTED: probable thionin-2.4 [Camelina sativa]